MVLFGHKWCVLEPLVGCIGASAGREKWAVAGAVQSKAGSPCPKMITFDDIVLYHVMVKVERSGTVGVVKDEGYPKGTM
jgi:hypothetical protein